MIIARVCRRITPRAVLLVTLAVAWLNFLLTVKWADVAGALNGWKRPWYAAALIVASVLAVRSRRIGQRVSLPALPIFITGAWALLVFGLFRLFPPSTWKLIPFFDDWPPRFVATVEGVRLLARGVIAGWQWGLVGGYQTSADLSQSLTILGAVPMALFGPALGYHVLHAGLMIAIPALVYWDIAADEPKDVARLSAFFVLIGVVGFYGTIWPSGDTNSIAGVFCVLMAFAGSRAAQLGRRWGTPLLVLGLTLALCTHLGFFVYASVYLTLEALFYRSIRMFVRQVCATAVAVMAALPFYWELIRYPSFFITNNVVYVPGHVDWIDAARHVYYNVEMLVHPHRWFNDYFGLTRVFLPIVGWVAWKAMPRRPGFYALAAVATVAMSMLDVPAVAGYLFARETHMLAVFTPVALAWFVVEVAGSRVLAFALVAMVGLYVQSQFEPVPHVADIRGFDAVLVDHIETLPAGPVLLEDNPHRNLIATPGQRSERTPFGTHFESLLMEDTGRRYYAQTWDGWHWTPFRGQSVAGGAFRGRAIGDTPVQDVVAEMRKWGVDHLVVWSNPTKAYLDRAPDEFDRRWSSGLWTDYEMRHADTRDVVVPVGAGVLRNLDPLGGTVAMSNVRAGDPVVVRMNYFPAWQGRVGDEPVPLRSVDGQLAFDAPRNGTYDLTLTYPRRYALSFFSVAVLLLGAFALRRV